jgi:hypothetical protein
MEKRGVSRDDLEGRQTRADVTLESGGHFRPVAASLQAGFGIRPQKHTSQGKERVGDEPAECWRSMQPEDDDEPAPERDRHGHITILESGERAGPASAPADARGDG